MAHVLVIEDQPDIQTLVKVILESSKRFTVESAGTGEDGLRRAKQNSPDVILLDFTLPDMDGAAIIQELKKNPATKDKPVIFLTALADPKTIELCRQAGALDVIAKPFTPKTLVSQIERLLSQRG